MKNNRELRNHVEEMNEVSAKDPTTQQELEKICKYSKSIESGLILKAQNIIYVPKLIKQILDLILDLEPYV